MASYSEKIEYGKFSAKVIIKRERKHYATNGYDADKVYSTEPELLFETTVTGDSAEEVQGKLTKVIEGGL